MKRVNKLRQLVLWNLFVVLLACLFSWAASQYSLMESRYTLTTDKLDAPIRLVQLTDLHNSEFGKDNRRLIKLIEKQNPDLILMTGDMLNGREPEREIAAKLVTQLTAIAPVYFSYGNHEVTHEKEFSVDLTDHFEKAGAIVLDRTYEDVTVGDQTIRLGGIYGFCLPERFRYESRRWEVEYLEELQDTENYTVLLAHLPTCWINNGILNDWNIDCVLSGHEHGGQIRLPWIGGLYAPDQGFFPGRSSGIYASDDRSRVMVLSRGLGSSNWIPRFNNVPEVVVVDLIPQEKGNI